jgi:hypothetical protein
VHTQDLGYTFNSPTSPARFPAVQDQMQRLLIDFVHHVVPGRLQDGTVVPHFGSERRLANIMPTGLELSTSHVNRTRCAWWQDW